MDKKVAGLVGGVAAALALSAPTSYAELLNPIPNAAELLKADNHGQPVAWFWNGYQWEQRARVPTPYEVPYYYHHHHHHHHNRDHHDHHHGFIIEER